MFFLQKVFSPQQNTKAQRPSGEDTAECSTFFVFHDDTKQTYKTFITGYKKPVTGNGFLCTIPNYERSIGTLYYVLVLVIGKLIGTITLILNINNIIK